MYESHIRTRVLYECRLETGNPGAKNVLVAYFSTVLLENKICTQPSCGATRIIIVLGRRVIAHNDSSAALPACLAALRSVVLLSLEFKTQ